MNPLSSDPRQPTTSMRNASSRDQLPQVLAGLHRAARRVAEAQSSAEHDLRLAEFATLLLTLLGLTVAPEVSPDEQWQALVAAAPWMTWWCKQSS